MVCVTGSLFDTCSAVQACPESAQVQVVLQTVGKEIKVKDELCDECKMIVDNFKKMLENKEIQVELRI